MCKVLNLESAPKVLFLFGLSGAGKSYVGDLVGELASWHVYHADDDLTDEMILALKEERPFTEAMRDRYFPIIAKKINLLQQQHENIVVTQGAYKQRHRHYLLELIPDMEMIWVDAPDSEIMSRLSVRNDGISTSSASALRLDFEVPPSTTKKIINQSGKSDVIRQLNLFYSQSPAGD